MRVARHAPPGTVNRRPAVRRAAFVVSVRTRRQRDSPCVRYVVKVKGESERRTSRIQWRKQMNMRHNDEYSFTHFILLYFISFLLFSSSHSSSLRLLSILPGLILVYGMRCEYVSTVHRSVRGDFVYEVSAITAILTAGVDIRSAMRRISGVCGRQLYDRSDATIV